MSINLKNITMSMFRSRYERESLSKTAGGYFYRFIGIDDLSEYDNVLKTIKVKCSEAEDKCIIFDGSIPLSGEMELIQYIFNELSNMNIYRMVEQDITIFDNFENNYNFLKALDFVIPIAVEKENFFNDNVRNNFITKLIVWVYTYAKDIVYDDKITPKCVYYGNITRHEIYFLMLLYKMGFDVIYINPLKEEFWDEIDDKCISKVVKNMGIVGIESFEEKASRGTYLEINETITKQLQREIEEDLFTDTGMYKPWQFRKGYTKSSRLDTIVEDLYIYWNEPCKLRSGFKVEKSNVTVPNFFFKIDGQYSDEFEYKRLVSHCASGINTRVYNTGDISGEVNITEDMYGLMFCQLSDGTFDIEELKKMPMYKFSKYSEDIQNFLLRKINETIINKELFVNNFNKEELLYLVVLIMNLNEDIVRMIDNFDYTGNIPKIVIYLNGEEGMSKNMQLLLGYLHIVGIDIVIFNPSGLFNINNVIKEKAINTMRLENMNYNSNFNKLMNLKKSVFSKILKNR